ncbi:ABC transporter permease [Aliifodinibius sp. S!AR15-10]|uniref:ABC transporter permease n=1 Tax=Aliifodinibius sp. S!AR15-10 TaxID=2950437 RepID=UPI00286069D4|nr:ABC transporter permease [Aliifodinibius sp. S!AR15-10]MDR8393448.1 ABC transporter permease [Aliifodinibius sp. S!AR15-10]
MLKNYLKVALRKLWIEKEYAFLNILGLTVGIAVSLLIIFYVLDEFSYDDFHTHAERIYRIQMGKEFGGDMQVQSILPEMIGPTLKETYPEIREAVRVLGPSDRTLVETDAMSSFHEGYIRTDSAFFLLFSFNAAMGNLAQALTNPEAVVLTRSMAEKYFGSIAVIGNRITINNEEKTVTAVIEDPPHNTHLNFSAIGRLEASGRKAWNYYSSKTYVLLNQNANVDQLREKLPGFIKDNAYRDTGHGIEKADPSKYALYLQPVTDIHLNPRGYGSVQKAGPMQYIQVFILAAILVLGIAIINYMNIATARSGMQAREVGVRQTVGAGRGQLMTRFLVESGLYAVMATAFALLLVELVLPFFNDIVDKEMTLGVLDRIWLIPTLLGFALFIGVLSGSYGALVMSSFRPAEVIKGDPAAGKTGAGFRKVLVVFQFTASIILILITVLIYQQMEFVRESRLNTNDDQIVVLQNYAEKLNDSYKAFRHKLLAYPEVEQVATGHVPGSVSARAQYADSTGAITKILFADVGYGYSDILVLETISGRTFSPEYRDSNAVVINESAAKWLGVERAAGQYVNRASGRVVGIVEDFHMLPLYQPISPMILSFREGAQPHILVKLRSGNISVGLDRIQSTWDSFVNEPALYSFLDEELDKSYHSELKMANIFAGFSGIAILLACLGLFGLSAYSAHQRTKEVGIRKVFGATVTDLTTLLSRDFIKLVLLGFIIATPIAYYTIHFWLKDFAYKIDVNTIPFILTGLATTVIAIATVSWQSIRAAIANPVESLRSE